MATTQVAVTTMKLAQITRPGGDFQIVEREIPEPGSGHVRIKVQACGVCHSDVFTKEGGGLGHLAIQWASKFGHRVAAIGRGPDREGLAKKLGAAVYIDSGSANAAEALQREGGALVILATAPSSKAMSEAIDGLAPNGKLVVIGVAAEPIEVRPVQLIAKARSIVGWVAGHRPMPTTPCALLN
jgi:D-arabinose 1-dehydrogenase-like Zn-dependent alcohol dehydrogenase